MPFVIERLDGGSRVYFSAKVGRDFGNPGGGWANDLVQATTFATRAAAEQRVAQLQYRWDGGCTVRET